MNEPEDHPPSQFKKINLHWCCYVHVAAVPHTSAQEDLGRIPCDLLTLVNGTETFECTVSDKPPQVRGRVNDRNCSKAIPGLILIISNRPLRKSRPSWGSQMQDDLTSFNSLASSFC